MIFSTNYRTALYCRLSKDDDQRGESISIETQRSFLEDYCREQHYPVQKIYVDDGFSGEYSAPACAPRPSELSIHSGGIEQSRRWR